MVIDFTMGERIRLRKKHPCGSFEWEVVRLGADIGIQCSTCSRKLLLPRSALEKRIKTRLGAVPGTLSE